MDKPLSLFYLVREEGLEPSHLTARAPKARVSAISPSAQCGRGCRIRTDDPRFPKPMLYQAELIPEYFKLSAPT